MGEAGGPDRRIHHQHQAIIPSYKFNCCGNITQLGVDLNPDRDGVNQTFNFILQVWRPWPSPTLKAECYSLVNDHSITSTSIGPNSQTGQVANVTHLPHNQLQFEPGDVLGFYVESHGPNSSNDDNGVVVLNDSSHTSELVWHGRITARTSQSGSCPYRVGTSGVLNTSTHAAPVISISAVMVTTCRSSNNVVHSSSALLVSITSTTSRDLTRTTVLLVSPSIRPNYVTISESSDGIIDNVLVMGIVTVVLIFVVASIIITIIFVVLKRQSGARQADNAGMTLSNQLYGESASCALHLIPAMINVFLF
jgi:hypothetical protein